MKTQTVNPRIRFYALIVWLIIFSIFLAGMMSTEKLEEAEEPAEITATLEPILNELEPTLTEMSTAPQQEPIIEEPAPRYALTDFERDIVERVVMAEAGGESFEGQMLVAQCILNAAEKTGTAPSEVVVA